MCLRTRRALARWCVVSLLLAPAGPLRAQAVAPDASVEEGVRQAEEGEYDAAILTLDAATRRLAGDHARAPELARAYVYLGIAYLAKGHETAARARFREALAQVRDLELEPEKFAPRVIELFEKAREEAKATAEAKAPEEPEPKGGGHKGLLIGAGVVAAGAAGVAIAAGGGDDTPPPSTVPVSTVTSFQGLLGPSNPSANLTVGPFRPGNCAARLTWSDGRTEVKMYVNDPASGNPVETNRETTTSSRASWTCRQGAQYRVELFVQDPILPVTYDLQLTVP